MDNKEFLKQIGLKLKCQRIMKELTIQDVSDKTGLSRVAIQDIEKGKSNFHVITLKIIVETLGFNVIDIL